MLPKMPDRASVTGNACAAAAIEVEASSGIVVVFQGVEECKIEKQNENENENEKRFRFGRSNQVEEEDGGATKVGITRAASDKELQVNECRSNPIRGSVLIQSLFFWL